MTRHSRSLMRHPVVAPAIAFLLALIAALALPTPGALAANFIVNDTGDAGDADTTNGTCATLGGVCTLRAAIEQANATDGPHTIGFNIAADGPQVIQSTGSFPTITRVVTIDGWSQGRFRGNPTYSGPPLIQVQGPDPTGSNPGIRLGTGSTGQVIGLAIGGFPIGIFVEGGTGHTIYGNYIGLAANGQDLLPNGFGLIVRDAANTTVGGTATGQANVISGNLLVGLNIEADDVAVVGNVIGLNATRSAARPNGTDPDAFGGAPFPSPGGIAVSGDDVAIGGTNPGEGNVVAGNAGDGIAVDGASAARIVGNFIGTTPDGRPNLGNSENGISAQFAVVDIGGSAPAARNVISGNGQAGIAMFGICGCGDEQTRVRGNYIGTNPAGTAALANGEDGILLYFATGIVVGGTAPGEGNVISGNARDGVSIVGFLAERVFVAGNHIGTNAAGTAAVPNGRDGVSLVPDQSSGGPGGPGPFRTIVGSEDPGAGNLISGNARHGVYLLRTRQDTVVVHNRIGVDATGGGSIGNGGSGILIERASRITVRENTVANSGRAGVVMMPRASANLGNVLTGNAIFANQGIGIDVTDAVDANGVATGPFAGKTPNDVPDADDVQNFPELTAATTSGAGTSVAGTLASIPTTSFRVEFFASPSCDPTGYGEGRSYLGGIDVGTDGTGNASFTAKLGTLPSGHVLTATATNPDRQTSEFSACKAISTAGVAVTPTGGLQTTEAGGTATFTVALTTAPTATVTINLTSSDTTEGTVSPGSLVFTSANALTPQTVTVTGVPDNVADGNQPYTIVSAPAVSDDPAYKGLDPTDVTVISQDSGALPTLSIADASAIEPTSGTRPIAFAVTLAPASTQRVTVEWQAVDGTARLYQDVGSSAPVARGTLTFEPGEATKQVELSVLADTVPEGTETFTVRLARPTNAALGREVATGTIRDEGLAPSSCAPRPNVHVETTRAGADRLRVTIKAQTSPGTPKNELTSLRIGELRNAILELPGQSPNGVGGVEVPLPPGTTETTFLLRRRTSGQAVLMPLRVVDTCGDWETFVGGGDNAF